MLNKKSLLLPLLGLVLIGCGGGDDKNEIMIPVEPPYQILCIVLR